MGIVYVLTNDAMNGLVKIGRTQTDIETRIKDLSTGSGVPVAFKCFYAAEVEDESSVEKALHQGLDDCRLNPKREFFEIEPHKVKALLEQMNVLAEVTPKSGPADSAEEKAAIEKLANRRANFRFSMVDISPGETLTSVRNSDETAEVLDDKKIRFRGEEATLSGAALVILNEMGYAQSTVQGPAEWLFGGETLASLRDETEEAED
jgi:hypothetical protein